jgi:hypothetical protein
VGGSDPRATSIGSDRQQNALRGLLDKAVTGGALADPAKLIALLDFAEPNTMSLDETLGKTQLSSGSRLQMPRSARLGGAVRRSRRSGA